VASWTSVTLVGAADPPRWSGCDRPGRRRWPA